MATSVPTTRSTNRAQISNEMSSNLHNTVVPNMEKSMFDCFAKRLADHFMPTHSTMDKWFGIERLKVLGAMTFEGTTNLAVAKKWLSLIESVLG